MSDEEFISVIENLQIMALHEEATAQVMHFPPINGDYHIVQLTIKKDISPQDLRFVITHELEHVLQRRNWQESDGTELENDADKVANNWGFHREKPLAEDAFGDISIY